MKQFYRYNHVGATDGTWTRTLLPAADFKSAVSANSTTVAYKMVCLVGIEPTKPGF